jgi:peptidoglycan-associated lipoprotein
MTPVPSPVNPKFQAKAAKMSRIFRPSLFVAVALLVSMVGCKGLRLANTRGETEGNGGNSSGTGIVGIGNPDNSGTTGIQDPTTIVDPLGPNGAGTAPVDIDKALGSLEDRFILKRDHGFGIVYFAFNQSFIGDQERPKCNAVGDHLVKNPTYSVLIEGNCDERGSEEYNRGLGERRALAVKDYLVNLGVDAKRIHTLSLGEEKPADPGRTEAAYALNRRAEFVILLPKP